MQASFAFVLLVLPLVCGFNNVLVLVLEDTSYLSSIEGKGVTQEFYYGSQERSVVSSLAKNQVAWKVYTDDHVQCYLDPVLLSNYSFLISYDDIADQATRCAHVASADDLNHELDQNRLPTFGFYFPSAAHNDPSWLRNFFFWKLRDPTFVENTLTIVLSVGQNSESTASVVLLGKAIQTEVLKKGEERGILNTMAQNGFNLTAPPPHDGHGGGFWFDRIFVVLLENQPLTAVLKNDDMRSLASQGTLLTEYNAITNPSQPNYIALTAGDVMGVTNDEDYDLTGRFIVDLFEENGISWKAYQENFPGNCYADGASPDNMYRRKHNPFISFGQVRGNSTLCSKIVEAKQLYTDIANNALPRYSFYTPNMDNDGHDTGVSFSASWLEKFLTPLMQSQNFMSKTLVVVTYDEGIKPDNKIYTLLLGDMVPFQNIDKTSYTHYSLLRLVEDHFNLPTLGRNDATATRIDAANFYPGTPDDPPSNAIFYILIAVMGLLILLTTGVAGYCLVVARKRRTHPAFIGLEENDLLDEGDSDTTIQKGDTQDEP